MTQGYRDIMASAAKEINKPAGDSDRFKSSKEISEDLNSFISEVHATWKKWHKKAIKEIMMFDAMQKADRKRPIGGRNGIIFKEWTTYMLQLWRRINDSIVWLMSGDQRHFMKRLCLYRKRGPISEANPELAYSTIEVLNSDPTLIAIWNDATSSVDVGDVTLLNKRINQINFIELKGGTVNAEIMKLNKSVDASEYQERFKKFVNTYGSKGIKQLERFERQESRNEQILKLIKNEKGMDPVTSTFLDIQELQCQDEDYDGELRDLLYELEGNKKEAYCLIDNCLWIYANNDSSLSLSEVTQNFRELLTKKESRLHPQLKMNQSMWSDTGITPINWGFDLPASRPLFLRNLDPIHIGDIAYGALQHRLLLYLDWEKFGQLFDKAGGEFGWSTDKQARRERAKAWMDRRSVIVNGRIPQFRFGYFFGFISGATLIRIMFDGTRPQSVVNQLAEVSRLLLDDKGEEIIS